jgi:hypothetical protein
MDRIGPVRSELKLFGGVDGYMAICESRSQLIFTQVVFHPFKTSLSVQSTSLHLSPSSERARPPPIKVIEFFII